MPATTTRFVRAGGSSSSPQRARLSGWSSCHGIFHDLLQTQSGAIDPKGNFAISWNWRTICLGELTSNPLGAWVRGRTEPQNLTAAMPQDQKPYSSRNEIVGTTNKSIDAKRLTLVMFGQVTNLAATARNLKSSWTSL
jgi:hypothetical protein